MSTRRTLAVGAAIAAVIAIGVGGSAAAGNGDRATVTSADIVDDNVRSNDIKNGGVYSPDINNQSVRQQDIRNGAVGWGELTPFVQDKVDEVAPMPLFVEHGGADEIDFEAYDVEPTSLDEYKPAKFIQESLHNGNGSFGANVALLIDADSDGDAPTAQEFIEWQADHTLGLDGDRVAQMDAAPQGQTFVNPMNVDQWYISNADGDGWADGYGSYDATVAPTGGKVLGVVYLIGGNDASWENDVIRVTPLG